MFIYLTDFLAYINANVIAVVAIDVDAKGGNGAIGVITNNDYADGINYC